MKTSFFILFLLGVSVLVFCQQEPVIRDGETFFYAAMEFQLPYDQLPQKMGEFFAEMQKQNVADAGEPMAIYFDAPAPGQAPRWAIAIPVDATAQAKPPLKIAEFKYAKTVELTYQGPYADMGPAYKKIFAFIAEKGYKQCGPIFETYLNDPASTAPADLRTLIVIPIEKI